MGASSSTPDTTKKQKDFQLFVIDIADTDIRIRREDIQLDGRRRAVVKAWITNPSSAPQVLWHYPLTNLMGRRIQATSSEEPTAWLVITTPETAGMNDCCESRLIVDFNTDASNVWTVSRLVSAFCTPCAEGSGVLVRTRPKVEGEEEGPPKKVRVLNDGIAVIRETSGGDAEAFYPMVDPLRAFFGQRMLTEMLLNDDLRYKLHGYLRWKDQRNLMIALDVKDQQVVAEKWRFNLDDVEAFCLAKDKYGWRSDIVIVDITRDKRQVDADHWRLHPTGQKMQKLRSLDVQNLVLYDTLTRNEQQMSPTMQSLEPYVQKNGGSLYVYRTSLGCDGDGFILPREVFD